MVYFSVSIRKALTAFAVCVVVSASAYSQGTSSHYKATENLISAMALDVNFKSSIDMVITAQSKAVPENQRQLFEAAMKEFFAKYASWEIMKAKYIALYMSEFSETELNDIAAFYRTPIGVKLMEKTPALTTKSMQIGQRLVTDHRDDLQVILKKYFGN